MRDVSPNVPEEEISLFEICVEGLKVESRNELTRWVNVGI